MDEEMEKLIKKSEEYAKSKGFRLNPNREVAEGVVKGLLTRKENFGEIYCPCRKMTGNKEEDKKIICPCIYHLDEIEKDGHCFCNLFVKQYMNKKLLAFTLIELLVVIAIIGILSGLIVVTMNGITSKANIAKSQVFSNSLKNALMLNLISEWRLDEGGTSQSTEDIWGTNEGILGSSSGVDTTDPTWTSSDCVRGNCLTFDGVNDFVNCGNASVLNISSGSITVEAWVYPQRGTNYIFGNSADNANWGYYTFKIQSQKPDINFNSSGGSFVYRSNNNVDLNKWSHIVATHTFGNGSLTKIYLNGIQQDATWISGTGNETSICTSTCRFEIGHWYGTPDSTSDQYHFYGKIDEARIYNAVVPTSRIKENYYSGLNSLLANGNMTIEEYLSRIVGQR
jgi:prepilin-type N-terminal cleavage/methylation domain-containing protein